MAYFFSFGRNRLNIYQQAVLLFPWQMYGFGQNHASAGQGLPHEVPQNRQSSQSLRDFFCFFIGLNRDKTKYQNTEEYRRFKPTRQVKLIGQARILKGPKGYSRSLFGWANSFEGAVKIIVYISASDDADHFIFADYR